MSSTETAREPRVRHAQGGRQDGDGGIDPAHLGRTWYSRALSAALESPVMSHPPWPPPTPVTALVPGKTQVLGWSVCVSGLLRLSAVGCRCRQARLWGRSWRRRRCWQHLEECHGGCRPQTACLSDRGMFSSGSGIMGAGVLACVDVCVPGSHACSCGLWAPVGHVSRPPSGHVGLNTCVNECPMRECTHAHTHVGVICEFLLLALELGTWAGTSGLWPPWGGRKRNN